MDTDHFNKEKTEASQMVCHMIGQIVSLGSTCLYFINGFIGFMKFSNDLKDTCLHEAWKIEIAFVVIHAFAYVSLGGLLCIRGSQLEIAPMRIIEVDTGTFVAYVLLFNFPLVIWIFNFFRTTDQECLNGMKSDYNTLYNILLIEVIVYFLMTSSIFLNRLGRLCGICNGHGYDMPKLLVREEGMR